MRIALALVLFAAAFRILPTVDFTLANVSPVMAIAFCGAVYFRRRWMWVVPFVALALSDLYIDHFYAEAYGYRLPLLGNLARLACFAAALLLGAWAAAHKSWFRLLTGSLLGALLFYLVTNSQSWWADPFYPKTLAGWWQALTVGRPEFPPTVYFFRNTLFGDLIFTGLFAGLMEWRAKRRGEPSLLDDDTVEGEQTAAPAEERAKPE